MSKNIIYIAGYGRSGSTILDILLSSSPSIVSAGESVYARDYISTNKMCTCSQLIHDCDYWKNVVSFFSDIVRSQRIPNSKINPLSKLSCAIHHFKINKDLTDFIVADFLDRHAATHFLDSSKITRRSFLRPLLFFKRGYSVQLIFLLRSPSSLLLSLRKGSNKLLQTKAVANNLSSRLPLFILRSLIGYIFSYSVCLVYKFLLPNSLYLVLDYDDLISDPLHSLSQISSFLNLDLSVPVNLVANNKSLSSGHAIAGNRVRSSTSVVFSQTTSSSSLKRHLKLYLIPFLYVGSFLYQLLK